jgi:Putative Flp pilus-assembly TadE/G-like
MPPMTHRSPGRDREQRGQIIVVAALALVAIIAGVSLVLEAGNAYAHQRVAQNAADAVANAGATVLAENLGGGTWTDADVANAMDNMATADFLDSWTGYYTNVTGGMLTLANTVTTDPATAARVGSSGTIPTSAQGVRIGGDQSFDTTFARVIGINQFTASADATAVTGRLTGGEFLPLILPTSPRDCAQNGNLQPFDDPTKAPLWYMSNPGSPHPNGTEYVIPLCKTGGGSFMILDLDPNNTLPSGQKCYWEVMSPPSVQFPSFPYPVSTDTGANCFGQIENGVADAGLQGKVVLIPICDENCTTGSGSNAKYNVTRIAALYLDFVTKSSAHNNPCAQTTSPTYGTPLVPFVTGNSSDGCIAGWFVRYVTKGPVGSDTVNNGEAIGVQLIR